MFKDYGNKLNADLKRAIVQFYKKLSFRISDKSRKVRQALTDVSNKKKETINTVNIRTAQTTLSGSEDATALNPQVIRNDEYEIPINISNIVNNASSVFATHLFLRKQQYMNWSK